MIVLLTECPRRVAAVSFPVLIFEREKSTVIVTLFSPCTLFLFIFSNFWIFFLLFYLFGNSRGNSKLRLQQEVELFPGRDRCISRKAPVKKSISSAEQVKEDP